MSILFHHYKQLVKLSTEIKEGKGKSSSLPSVSEISLPKVDEGERKRHGGIPARLFRLELS